MHSHAPDSGGAAQTAAVPPVAFVVGEWRVAPDLNEVSRDGRTLHVRPQLMDLLVYLARNHGRTVPRDELQAHVWPGQPFITVTALPRCIAELRQALGDSASEPALIQTIPKRGYRLIAPVRPLTDAECPSDAEPAIVSPAICDAPARPCAPVAAATAASSPSYFLDSHQNAADVRILGARSR